MARLKFRHFEVLIAIARCGTLTAAADALGISQSAVSQWLADLEFALGVPLFLRGRQLRPTQFADVVLRHAQRVLADAKRTQEEVDALRNGATGRVRLGIMQAAAPTLLPRVRSGAWPTESLYDDPHVVISGPHHALVRAPRVAWADVARYPLILPPASTPLRGAIDATFVNAGLPMPQPWIESTSQSANHAVLRETDALAVTSRTAARYFTALGMVHALPVSLSVDVGPLGMVWHDVAPDPMLARVLAAARTEAQALVKAQEYQGGVA